MAVFATESDCEKIVRDNVADLVEFFMRHQVLLLKAVPVKTLVVFLYLTAKLSINRSDSISYC